MTARTLEEIEALAKDATPGPWRYDTVDYRVLGTEKREVVLRDFSLASGSRTPEQRKEIQGNTILAMSAPDLLRIAQEQRAEIERLRKEVRGRQDECPFPG